MKKLILTLSALILLWVWVSFVFWNFINFEKNIQFIDANSINIFPDSKNINTNLLVFKSNTDISNYSIKTSCKNSFKFIWKKDFSSNLWWDVYFFNFKILNKNCENPNFILKNEKEIFIKSSFKLNIENKNKIFKLLVDYSTEDLNLLKLQLDKKIKKYSIYNNFKQTSKINYFNLLKRNRLLKELIYKKYILANILNRRMYKYANPVKWYYIWTAHNIIPNSWRPYRADYTDGIHHWWDVMAPIWTMTSAIDDGIIIRIKRNFEYEDLSKIIKGNKISDTQKLRNLDLLRWNQVWLKTTKGDVMFYSHLKKVESELKEWDFVPVWTKIWTIGMSGVPDKSYSNYHLHFPIHKNPYLKEKAWKYSWEDYMAWDWYLKWLSLEEVVKQQINIFSKEAFREKIPVPSIFRK